MSNPIPNPGLMHFKVYFEDGDTVSGKLLKDGGDGWSTLPDKTIDKVVWVNPCGDALVLQGYDQYCYRIDCAADLGKPAYVSHILLMGEKLGRIWQYKIIVQQRPKIALGVQTPVHYLTNFYPETLDIFGDYNVKIKDIGIENGKVKFLTDPRGNHVYVQEPDYHKWKRSLRMDTDALGTFCQVRGLPYTAFERSIRCTMRAAQMFNPGDMFVKVIDWKDEETTNPTHSGWRKGTGCQT